jgi:hypothetical protein
MQIRIYETVSQKPNGDRATKLSPSSSFEVVLINGENRSTIFKNNQFNSFWTYVEGTREQYLAEAMKAAEDMAKTLGGCEIVGVQFTKREKEITDLEASIKRDQEKLQNLKKLIL